MSRTFYLIPPLAILKHTAYYPKGYYYVIPLCYPQRFFLTNIRFYV